MFGWSISVISVLEKCTVCACVRQLVKATAVLGLVPKMYQAVSVYVRRGCEKEPKQLGSRVLIYKK